MKIALASAKCVNRDIDFNFAQIENYMRLAKEQGADLVCFAEAFLQGFDAFDWKYEIDRNMAISLESDLFRRVCTLTEDIGIDLMLGFLECEGENLYSSCALIGDGKLIHLYRRISKGWKEYTKTDAHYKEGASADVFQYRGKNCLIALCGDLWDDPKQFKKGQEILFWPVYVNFTTEEWEREFLAEYIEQAALAGSAVLMVNAITEAPDDAAFGGCYHFENGIARAALPMGEKGILVVDV